MSTTHEAPLVMDYRAMAADERRNARRYYRRAVRYVRDAARQREFLARHVNDETMSGAVEAGRRLLAAFEAGAPRCREMAREANARARRYDRLDAERRAEWDRIIAEGEAAALAAIERADAVIERADAAIVDLTVDAALAAAARPFFPRGGRAPALAVGYVDPPFVCNTAGNDLDAVYEDSDAYPIVMGGLTGVFFPLADGPDQGGRFVPAPPAYQAVWQAHVRRAVARLDQPAGAGAPY